VLGIDRRVFFLLLGVKLIVKEVEVAEKGIRIGFLLEDLEGVGGVCGLSVVKIEGVITLATELLLHILI
jgi:hypothetical protein